MSDQPRKALGNATILTLGSAAETVLQMGFLVIVGRQLGPEEFGFYGYLLSIVTFAATVAQFGLPVVAVRELAQRPAEEPRILAATFRIRGAFSVAIFLAALIAAVVSPMSPAHRTTVWLMFAYTLFVPFDLSLLFDAHKLSRWDVPGKLSGRVVSVGLIALLWYVRGSVTIVDVALASSLLMLVNGAVGWQMARRQKLPLQWLVKTRETGKLIAASLPVLWSNIMTIAYTQSQTILLKWFSTPVETGYYALASRLMMPVLIFRGVIYRVMFPLISEVALDAAALTARLERILPVLALIFMPAVAFAIPATEVLLVPIFGPDYAGAVLPFQLMISVYMLSGMGAMCGTSLLASGDARTPTVGLTVGCLISLGFALLVVPQYGAVGAAWSSFIGELISVCYTIPIFLKRTRPKVMGRILRIAAASLTGTASFYLLRYGLSLAGGIALAASVVVLVLGLALIGEISRARLQTYLTLFRKPAAAPVPAVTQDADL